MIPPGNLGVSIPRNKEEAILKAMSVQPSERFQSMGAFKQALLGINVTVPKVSAKPETVVEQRVFAAPLQETPAVQQYVLHNTAGEDTDTTGKNKKKRLILAGIFTSAAVVVFVLSVVFWGSRKKPANNKVAGYDRTEENISGNTESSRQDSIINQQSTQAAIQEKKQTIVYREIDGNLSNNLSQGGRFSVDDDAIIFSYPAGSDVTGGGMACIYNNENGDMTFFEKQGNITCINLAGDMIYYLYDFKAYQMKRDGAGKERISELSDYSWITWLYVSEKYYYIYSGSLEEVKAGLYCINRETGIIEGMLPCAHGYFTFLDGSVYYMENYDTVYRVPADNFKARSEEVLTLKSGETCLGLASEGDYVYGLYTADSAELFFQHNIKTQKNNFYKLNQEGVMNGFNVVDSDIYFMTRDTIYRFRAEPEASAFQIETFYSHPFGEEWYMESFEILKDNSIAVLYVTVRAGNEKFVLINLDGKAEPVIIDGT